MNQDENIQSVFETEAETTVFTLQKLLCSLFWPDEEELFFSTSHTLFKTRRGDCVFDFGGNYWEKEHVCAQKFTSSIP